MLGLAFLRSNTPGLLFTVAFALYAVAPAAVYFIPDDSTPLIVAQVTPRTHPCQSAV